MITPPISDPQPFRRGDTVVNTKSGTLATVERADGKHIVVKYNQTVGGRIRTVAWPITSVRKTNPPVERHGLKHDPR